MSPWEFHPQHAANGGPHADTTVVQWRAPWSTWPLVGRSPIHVCRIQWNQAISASNDTSAPPLTPWSVDETQSGTGKLRNRVSLSQWRVAHTQPLTCLRKLSLYQTSQCLSLCFSVSVSLPSSPIPNPPTVWACVWVSSVHTETEKSRAASPWWFSQRDSTDFLGSRAIISLQLILTLRPSRAGRSKENRAGSCNYRARSKEDRGREGKAQNHGVHVNPVCLCLEGASPQERAWVPSMLESGWW